MKRNRNGAGVQWKQVLFAAALGVLPALAQNSPYLTPGNIVVVVEGCGVYQGTCASVPDGTGNGSLNSSSGGYGDNQAAPLTLFQFTVNGAASAVYQNSVLLPQSAAGANYPVSGEYGSSSEGTIQLSQAGQYLALVGYGINAQVFDQAYFPGFTADPYGAAPSGALAQSGSLTGQTYTPVARVATLIDANGNINSASAILNVFNTNNPRSMYTVNGSTAYLSGQGSGDAGDASGGVFYVPLGAPVTSPTAITGFDSSTGTVSQDTRDVQIYSDTLYISIDSKEGSGDNRSFIGTLGTPPAISLYTPPTSDPYSTGPTMLAGFGNTGGTGKVTITSTTPNTGNGLNAGEQINISPVSYFFASPSVLYVADGGDPKNNSATSSTGDGGLQKWVNSESNGSGTWSLAYTLYQGLNLVLNNNTNGPGGVASGTSGLYGLTGTVSGNTVYLYATNYTLNDLDHTYLYGIVDNLTYTTPTQTESETFTQLAEAPADSNFKGVSFVPTTPAGDVEITSSPSGLSFTSSGGACAAGTYTTPVTLTWTPGNPCQLSVASPQTAAGIPYYLAQWQDGTTGTTDSVTAPASTSSSIYTFTASFVGDVTSEVSVTGSGLVYSRGTKEYTGTVTITNTSSATIAGPIQEVFYNLIAGATLVNATGTVPSGPYAGAPYITATASSLAPGASVSFPIQYSYTGTAPISGTPKTLSGAF